MNKHSYRSPTVLLAILILFASLCFYIYFSQHPSFFRIPSVSSISFQPTPTTKIGQSDVTRSGQLVSVLYVVDGDTIDVAMDGKDTRVRLIGINAPEKYNVQTPECFAADALTFLKNRIDKKQVYLMSDPSQDEKDKYGRLLRYVFLEDGTDIDLELIEQGYAKEYTYKMPYQYQQQFRTAQGEAKAANKGVWGSCSN